jgi:hypothetical protein
MIATCPRHPWLVVLLAASMLAGCGRDTGLTPARPARTTANRQAMPPTGLGGAGMVPGAFPPGAMGAGAGMAPGMSGNAEGEQLLAAVRAQGARINSLEATIRSFTQGYYSGGERSSELKRATNEVKVTWASPKRIRLEILKTTNPLVEGAVLTTVDLAACRVRAKGLLSWLPITMQATDSKLANNRNHGLADQHPKAAQDRLTAPGAVWTLVGDGVVEGVPVKIVRVTGVRMPDHEVDRELVGIDPAQMVIRKVLMYAGNTKVGDHTLVTFRANVPISAETFKM